MQRPLPLIPAVGAAGGREGVETTKPDDRALKLISVGASVAANCPPCLETCVARARESGADEEEIGEAIEVAKQVRLRQLEVTATTERDSLRVPHLSIGLSAGPPAWRWGPALATRNPVGGSCDCCD